MPPLLALLFPERPRSSAFRPVALLSALEALPSSGVPSLPASPAPLLFDGFFTSLLVFFNLSCTILWRAYNGAPIHISCFEEGWESHGQSLPLQFGKILAKVATFTSPRWCPKHKCAAKRP